jgi:hypothetical protein
MGMFQDPKLATTAKDSAEDIASGTEEISK